MSHASGVPVLTSDGPSGSGKGTVSARVAQALGWRLLDSGALYRAVGYAAGVAGLDLSDVEAVTRCARSTRIRFRPGAEGAAARVIVNGHDATDDLRTETAGGAASAIAAMPSVRAALVDLQLAFRRAPGLVADGRDMGTVIFPDAAFKVFLTASAAERAKRRYTLADLQREIEARDSRDASRTVAPLKPADDAVLVDTTGMSVEEVVARVFAVVRP